MNRLRAGWLAVAVAAVLVCAGCGGGDSGNSATQGSQGAPTSVVDTATPQEGGVLRIGVVTAVNAVDPIITSGNGSTGGMELGSIYDRLLEWNPQTHTYDPKTAESVTPNADYTVWTIKLRSGIKFANGDSYDADAVKFNIDRQKTDSKSVNRGALAIVSSVDVVDPLTVRVTLSSGWSGFPFLLASAVGMLAAPSVVKAMGDTFGANPVGAGAGPFKFVAFKPNESLDLARNDTYWGQKPHLDGLKFIPMPQAELALESLKSKGADAIYLRDAKVAKAANDAGFAGSQTVMNFGSILLINNGIVLTCNNGQPAPACDGKANGTTVASATPGQDKRVREAVLRAIDPNVVNDRSAAGAASVAMFVDDFPWNPNVPLPPPDPARARQLVAEAKQAGWDGKIRLACASDTQAKDVGLAVETMLKAVGIDVQPEAGVDTRALVDKVIVKRDYDLACWGLTVSPDDGAQAQLDTFLRSTSPSNRTGYKSSTMDAALDKLKVATTDDQRTAAYHDLAETVLSDVPAVVMAALPERIAWNSNVHGVRSVSSGSVMFDGAWLQS